MDSKHTDTEWVPGDSFFDGMQRIKYEINVEVYLTKRQFENLQLEQEASTGKKGSLIDYLNGEICEYVVESIIPE